MRIPPYIGRLCKLAVVITVVAISVMTAGSRSNYLTPKDKAFYADENLINFVRPGLVLRVVSGAIADDGTIKARVRITDPRGCRWIVWVLRRPVQWPLAVWPLTSRRAKLNT
jgi:hypothetical protein